MHVYKTIALLLSLVAIAAATSFKEVVEEEWNEWKTLHNRQYPTKEEDLLRKKVFMRNKAYIARHNALTHQGKKTYSVKMNHLGDKLPSEMKAMYGLKPSQNQHKNEGITHIPSANVDLPNEVDWRNNGAVTGVKEQGPYCGSCWAFAATGALEGQHFRKTGRLISLSEQQLVDCLHSDDPGYNGCEGDNPMNAFRYIKKNGGIDTEASYPYQGLPMKKTCHFNPKNIGATDKGFAKIPHGDEEALKSAVATVGPIAVGIAVSHVDNSFDLYQAGVYDEAHVCLNDLKHINHAVLVVGYGTENGKDFWIVKNSWGQFWGDQGYIKMARNKKNQCGIATLASYPLV